VADLFVSYSRADADAVRRLCEALVAHKREVWVDWRDIPPTAQWREEIRAAIDAASAVVFVLSPAWVASAECRRELDHAAAQGKRLIPVVLQKPDMAAVPSALAELNWIFLHADDLEACVRQLLRAVDTDLDWSRAHAELLRRATAWQAGERDPGKLLRGRDLAEAERWLATDTTAPKPVAVQSAYVLASRSAAVRGQRHRVALAIGVAVVAVGLSIWAFFERQVAQRRYQEALSRQLTIESNTVRNAQPDRLVLGVQLAAEAMRRVPSPEADDALRAGLRLLPRLRWEAQVPTRTGIGVAFTPDGAHVATADAVWAAATGERAVEFGHEGRTTHFAMSPDGRLVARIGGQRLQLWDRAAGRQVTRQAPERRIPFAALAFSRDGRRLAAADMQHTVHVWDTAEGALGQSLPAPEALSGPVRGIAFGPDGGVIAVARRQRIERWETSSWKRFEPALTLEGGAVAAIDYAADGRLAAVTSSGEIVVHARDGTPGAPFRLPAELGRPESLRFSPDGRYIGVTAKDGAQVIDAENGKALVRSALGEALVFAPDAARVAVGGKDRTARVLDLAEGRELARMVHGAGVAALAFSPDGATLASLSDDGALRLWEAQSAFPMAALRGETGAFIDGGHHLLARGERAASELWSRDSRRTLRLPQDESPRQTFLSADGTRLMSVIGDALLAWPLPDAGEPVRMAHAPAIDWDAMRRRDVDERGGSLRPVTSRHAMLREAGSVEIAAMSPDARRVLTTRIDEIARLWDTRTGGLVAEIPYTVQTGAAFSGDGTRIAVVAAPGVLVLDAASGRALSSIPMTGRVGTVLLSHDGRRLVALHDEGASLLDVDTAGALAAIKGVRQVHFAPGGRSLVTEAGNEAQWLDAATGKVLAAVKCQCRIRDTVFAAEGRLAAIVADDNRIYVRSLEPGDAGRDVEHTGLIGQVAFSPDGKLLALTGSDPIMVETEGNVGQPRATGQSEPWQRLVELRSGREIALEQERAETDTPVFSADGRYLAAGGVVWDAATGRRLARAEGQILAFSPDQRLLVTREGNAIRAWPWRSEDMLALACSQLSRNLTEEEWQRHVSREEPRAKTCAGLP
jgi:WD40 repeat protein